MTELMRKTIFLTGGSGFVGQSLIQAFRQAGYQVLALARSEHSAQKVEALGAKAVQDDLVDLSDRTAKALRQCSIVVHSAAHMDFTYHKALFYAINVEATKELVAMAKNAGIQRFIYISAVPVVANMPMHRLREEQASSDLPTGLYPLTKALGERIVLEADTPGFTTLSLRPPFIWGPDNPHFQEIKEAVEKGQWAWVGGGHHVMSTIHVNNLSAAVIASLENGRGGEAYFVTDGEFMSLRNFFTKLLAQEGVAARGPSIPRWLAWGAAHLLGGLWKTMAWKSRPPLNPVMVRMMGTELSVLDEKARIELGYRNVLSMEEGFSRP